MYYFAIVIVLIIFIWRIIAGFRKGMVAEIVSLISLIFAIISLILVLNIAGSYFGDREGNVLQMLLVLVVIGLVYKVISLILTSLKLIAKLPVIKSLDKLLGAALGAVEATLIIILLIQVLKYFSFSVPFSL
ncbi:MAG: CvpA family protein [Lachnospiraceae bacterium]|nr:CvpA family protein [Lachnospiraceae bacterium]